MNPIEKFYVLTKEKIYYEFDNYKDLLYWIKDRGIISFGHNWNDCISIYDWLGNLEIKYPCDYIAKDSYWRTLPIEQIKEDIQRIKKEKYNRHKRTHINWIGWRNGPVPWAGRRYSFHPARPPRTYQEIKELTELSRARRKHLPTLWTYYKDRRGKSWKKNTKNRKQWM